MVVQCSARAVVAILNAVQWRSRGRRDELREVDAPPPTILVCGNLPQQRCVTYEVLEPLVAQLGQNLAHFLRNMREEADEHFGRPEVLLA